MAQFVRGLAASMLSPAGSRESGVESDGVSGGDTSRRRRSVVEFVSCHTEEVEDDVASAQCTWSQPRKAATAHGGKTLQWKSPCLTCYLRAELSLRTLRAVLVEFLRVNLPDFEVDPETRSAVVRASSTCTHRVSPPISDSDEKDDDISSSGVVARSVDELQFVVGKHPVDNARIVKVRWVSACGEVAAAAGSAEDPLSAIPQFLAENRVLRSQAPVAPSTLPSPFADAAEQEPDSGDSSTTAGVGEATGSVVDSRPSSLESLAGATIRYCVRRWVADPADKVSGRKPRGQDVIAHDPSEVLRSARGEVVRVLFPRHFAMLRAARAGTNENLLESFSEIANPECVDMTGGKSGSLFFRSADGRFLLKSVNQRHELATLRRLVPALTSHIRQSATSCRKDQHVCLLVPILGVFEFRAAGAGGFLWRSQTYVLMPSVFEDGRRLTMGPFDLKGSTIGRHTETGDTQGESAVKKDLDFIQMSDGLIFSRRERRAFWKAATADANFLREHGITDYSLLLGMAERGTNISPLAWQTRVADHAKKKVLADGGGACDPEIFVGVIDILQSHTLIKRLETSTKVVLFGGMESVVNRDARHQTKLRISSADPDLYAKRFIEFVRKVVAPRQPDSPESADSGDELINHEETSDDGMITPNDGLATDLDDWEKM